MSFEFVCVGTGVVTVDTCIGPFTCVRAHVSFHLAQFYTGVVTFCTLMGLLKCVFVPRTLKKFEFVRIGTRIVTVDTRIRTFTGV